MKPYQIWTDKEKKILEDWLKEENPDRDELCKKLKRNWNSIHCHLNQIKISPPPVKIDLPIEDAKKEVAERIIQKEFKALKQKRTLYEIVGEQILSAVEKLPTGKPEKIPIFSKEDEDEEEMALLISDSHIGLLVEAKDSGGLGEYNVQIFERRLEFFKKSLAKIFAIHFRKTPYRIMNIFFLGDMIENMVLRPSQMRLTDLKIVEQIILAVDKFSYLMAWLAGIFEEVRIHCVVGNHPRPTKEIGQYAPTDNFDYLVYKIMAERLGSYGNVHFNISESWWMTVERMGIRFYVEHGEEFRSWLGIPFYGLKRGKANIRDLFHQYLDEKGRPADFDYFLIGHIHQHSKFNDIISNGAFVGGSEYSLKRLKIGNPASQFCFSIHPDFGITWQRELVLDDPQRKPKVKYYE